MSVSAITPDTPAVQKLKKIRREGMEEEGREVVKVVIALIQQRHDETRSMQNYLVDLVVTEMERRTGTPL